MGWCSGTYVFGIITFNDLVSHMRDTVPDQFLFKMNPKQVEE